MSLQFQLGSEEQIRAAVIEGVRQTLGEPAFIRAVVEQLAGDVCWLTKDQVSKLLGRSPRTIARWLKANKIKASGSLGPKDQRVKLADVRRAMEDGAIRAVKTPPRPPGPSKNKPAVQGNLPTPAPLRAVSIRRATPA